MFLILIKMLNLIIVEFIILNFYFQYLLFMFIRIKQFIYSLIVLFNINHLILNKITLNHYIFI